MENKNKKIGEIYSEIIDYMYDVRKGFYVHALEVESLGELLSIIESLVDNFSPDFSKKQIETFIFSLSIYCMNDENETEVYDYHLSDFFNELF